MLWRTGCAPAQTAALRRDWLRSGASAALWRDTSFARWRLRPTLGQPRHSSREAWRELRSIGCAPAHCSRASTGATARYARSLVVSLQVRSCDVSSTGGVASRAVAHQLATLSAPALRWVAGNTAFGGNGGALMALRLDDASLCGASPCCAAACGHPASRHSRAAALRRCRCSVQWGRLSLHDSARPPCASRDAGCARALSPPAAAMAHVHGDK